MNSPYRFSVAVLALAALFLTGCVGSAGPPPDYYLLTARPSPADTGNRDIGLGVGPVRVAPFLERQPIVTYDADGAVRWRASERWAEPLDRGIQRVLVQNLEAMTGAAVRSFPWRRSSAPDYALRVEVLDLNRTAAGQAVLEVNWLLEDLSAQAVIDGGHDIFTMYGAGAGTGDLVAAYSELMARLADRAVRNLPER